MKFVIQRVKKASVKVDDEYTGKIKKGYLVLIGVGQEDTKEEADKYIRKMINLRILKRKWKNQMFIKRCGWRIVVSISVYALCKLQKRKSSKFYTGRRSKESRRII